MKLKHFNNVVWERTAAMESKMCRVFGVWLVDNIFDKTIPLVDSGTVNNIEDCLEKYKF